MNRGYGSVARLDQVVAFTGRQIGCQRHHAVGEEAVDGARGIDGQLRVQLYRFRQVLLALFHQRRHLFQTSGSGQGAIARRVVFLLQEREDPVGAFVDVGLWIKRHLP